MINQRITKLISYTCLFISLMLANIQNAQATNPPAGADDKILKFMNNSWGILIVSGIGTVFSGVLIKGANEQIEQSKKNIEHIDKISKTFQDSYAAFCPNGRDDLKEPKCYCYDEKGAKNENRSNSQVCKDQWAGDDYKLAAKAKNYNAIAANRNPTGCIKFDNTFDENCQCKKLVNSKGENACKKGASLTNIQEGYAPSLVTSSNLKNLEKIANDLAQGTANLDSIDLSALKANAISNRRFAELMRNKINNDKNKNIPFLDEKMAENQAKRILGNDGYNAAANSGVGAMANLALPTGDSNLNRAISEAKKSNPAFDLTGGTGLDKKTADKKSDNFDFSLDSSQGSSAGVIEGFEAPNYKYTNSDINTNEDVSIFEVINNRYVQSGLRRLFEDEKETQTSN